MDKIDHESREAVRVRLMAEGRWDAFVVERERLTRQGMGSSEAQRLTLAKFAPLTGPPVMAEPVTIALTKEQRALVDEAFGREKQQAEEDMRRVLLDRSKYLCRSAMAAGRRS